LRTQSEFKVLHLQQRLDREIWRVGKRQSQAPKEKGSQGKKDFCKLLILWWADWNNQFLLKTKEKKMNKVQIREELKAITSSDESVVRDIAFALNLIATNHTLVKAVEENVINVALIAYELERKLS
jgi:hypothetical protein